MRLLLASFGSWVLAQGHTWSAAWEPRAIRSWPGDRWAPWDVSNRQLELLWGEGMGRGQGEVLLENLFKGIKLCSQPTDDNFSSP